MTKRLKAGLLFSLSFLFFIASSKAQKEQLDPDIFQGLISIVIEENDSLEFVPPDLEELVTDYYAEAIIPESVANDVLSYLTGIYSEHGYHDSGSWESGKNFGNGRSYVNNYVPYKGELPDYNQNDFIMPANGRLTSVYGYRPRFKRFHRGIDISLNSGDTVRCVLPGIVSKTGYEIGGYGKYVVVSHSGGIDTLYGHLYISSVVPGQKMMAGEAIGLGGTTGNATGPHLHFETRYRGVPIDPIPWFNIHP